MTTLKRSVLHTRPIAVIVLITMLPQLAGCATWRVQQVAPAQAVVRAAADSVPRDLRIRLRHDKGTLVIQHARVVGDSIVGTSTENWGDFGGRPHRVAAALSDVAEVAVPEPSTGRSILALGVVVVLVGVIAAVISISSWHMGGGLGGMRL